MRDSVVASKFQGRSYHSVFLPPITISGYTTRGALRIAPCCGLETPTVAMQEFMGKTPILVCFDTDDGPRDQVFHVHGGGVSGSSQINLGPVNGDFNKAFGTQTSMFQLVVKRTYDRRQAETQLQYNRPLLPSALHTRNLPRTHTQTRAHADNHPPPTHPPTHTITDHPITLRATHARASARTHTQTHTHACAHTHTHAHSHTHAH